MRAPTELDALARQYLSPVRALRLWLLVAVHIVGWMVVGVAVGYFETGEGFGILIGVVFLGVALVFLAPSVFGVVILVHDDREVAERLRAEADAPCPPDGVPDWHVPGHALLWLLPSLILGCCGLTLALYSFGDTADMGTGAALAAGGAVGLHRAATYYRMVTRQPDR